MALGFLEKTDSEIRLTDFRLAGFLVARNQVLARTEVNSKNEVVFVFSLDALAILDQFSGSPEQQYDHACKAMHKLVRATLAP